MNIIFYEKLCLQTEVEIPRTFQIIGHDYNKNIYSSLENPSGTVTHESAIMHGLDRTTHWKTKLTQRQIDVNLSIVKAFGLDNLYGDSPIPQNFY